MDKTNELSNTLDRVMDMLKYAEAKNTVLLTFESGLLYLIFSEYLDEIVKNPWNLFWVTPLLISFIILIISYLPKLLTSNKEDSKNIQFFGHISKIAVDEYTNLYNTKFNNIDEFNSDLIAQIHYNSGIANKKFQAFKLAINVLFVLPIVIKVIVHLYAEVIK